MGDPSPRNQITPSPSPLIDTPLSGLQQFIYANQLSKDSTHAPQTHQLALQIAHNLRFQHDWTEIRLHYRPSSHATAQSLPRPVISGLPPQRLYVHPDEQIEVLQQQRQQGKAGWPELAREREWVLPSQLRETWSLRRFAEVFDALSAVPAEKEGGPLSFEAERRGAGAAVNKSEGASSSATPATPGLEDGMAGQGQSNRWRTTLPKRMLLATLDDDSTIVYYIVHDGLVKPRQN